MNNYEYIIASLPLLSVDSVFTPERNFDSLVGEIIEQCSEKDCKLIHTLLQSFNAESLDEAFYLKALKSKNSFLKQFLLFDLELRNSKVRYLNRSLGRSIDTDILAPEGVEWSFLPQAEKIFTLTDILQKEKAIDNFIWAKVEEINVLEDFSIDAILGNIVKLHIIDRWYKLDPQEGKMMFKKLLGEVKKSFKGVDFKPE